MTRAFLHRISFALLAAALLQGAQVRADESTDDKMSRMLNDPALAEGMDKVVKVARKGETCRKELKGCLKSCAGDDNSTCIMGCQTDCGVCVYEEDGVLNTKVCDL